MSLKDNLKAWMISYFKKHPNQRFAARVFLNRLRGNHYMSRYGNLPLDDKKVLFEVFNGRQYSCNPRWIYEEMKKSPEFDGWTYVWAFEHPEDQKSIPALKDSVLVEVKSDEYYREFATAKYIIVNSMLFGGLSRKDDQVIMQTWHGTPLKRLRCDIEAVDGNVNNTLEEIKARNDSDIVRYTHFLSPSAWASDRFISAFNLNEMDMKNIITETGYPRNDILTNYTSEDVDDIFRTVGAPRDKKVILYAPTFRDNKHISGKGYKHEETLDFKRLQEEFGAEYIILFRTHYFIANSFDFGDYEGFIYDVSGIADISELYLMADILITDYSSVFFDYACMKKPMIFYMYDLENYENDIRGFYLDIKELPGDVVRNENELVEAIHKISKGGFSYDEKYRSFNKRFNYLDDGLAAKRVIEAVFHNQN